MEVWVVAIVYFNSHIPSLMHIATSEQKAIEFMQSQCGKCLTRKTYWQWVIFRELLDTNTMYNFDNQLKYYNQRGEITKGEEWI